MGNNEDGQRGLGHNRVCLEPTLVKLISDKFIKVDANVKLKNH